MIAWLATSIKKWQKAAGEPGIPATVDGYPLHIAVNDPIMTDRDGDIAPIVR